MSLGFVEAKGYVPFYAVADAMLKAADVTLVKKVWVGAGYLTAVVSGEIGDVNAAVEAGAKVAESFDGFHGKYVIAAPRKEVLDVIERM